SELLVGCVRSVPAITTNSGGRVAARTAVNEVRTTTSTHSTPPGPTSRPPRIARYALVLGGLTAFGPLSVDMYLPALPAMADDLHSSDAQVQLPPPVFLPGLAVRQPVPGP